MRLVRLGKNLPTLKSFSRVRMLNNLQGKTRAFYHLILTCSRKKIDRTEEEYLLLQASSQIVPQEYSQFLGCHHWRIVYCE
jgi:hypothetical protein